MSKGKDTRLLDLRLTTLHHTVEAETYTGSQFGWQETKTLKRVSETAEECF